MHSCIANIYLIAHRLRCTRSAAELGNVRYRREVADSSAFIKAAEQYRQ